MTDDRQTNSAYSSHLGGARAVRTNGKPANRPSDAAFVGLLATVALVGVVALLASLATAVRPGKRRRG